MKRKAKSHMRLATYFLVLSLLTSPTWAQDKSGPASDEQKTFYALGMEIGKSLGVFKLSDDELKWVITGLTDETKGTARKDLGDFRQKIRAIAEKRMKAQAVETAKEGSAFLTAESKKTGAETTK